jgi:hypothetical protein
VIIINVILDIFTEREEGSREKREETDRVD